MQTGPQAARSPRAPAAEVEEREEVAELSAAEDYWKHVQNKVIQLERMWRDLRPPGHPRQEMK